MIDAMRTGGRFAAVGVLAAVWLAGCGMIESAAEIEVGKGQLPKVEQTIDWPDIDEMTGSVLSERVESSKKGELSLPGLPTSLKAGTLAHVQGLLSLAGDCRREFLQESMGEGGDQAVSNLKVQVTNCTGDDRCVFLCDAFRGIELEASVELLLLDEAKAKNLKKSLSSATPEALTQVRLQFFALELYQNDNNGEREIITSRFDDFDLVLSNADGDEVSIVERKYLELISEETPQRFEIPADSAVLAKLKNEVLGGVRTSFRIGVRARVAQPDLYDLKFDGAGVRFVVQPEVVISALEIVKSL